MQSQNQKIYLKFKSCFKKTFKNAKPESGSPFSHVAKTLNALCSYADAHHWKTQKNEKQIEHASLHPILQKPCARRIPRILGTIKQSPPESCKRILIINLKNALAGFSKVAQGFQGIQWRHNKTTKKPAERQPLPGQPLSQMFVCCDLQPVHTHTHLDLSIWIRPAPV